MKTCPDMTTIFEFDTEYSADAVEFCPFDDTYLIGTYQLLEGKRVGRLYLMQDSTKLQQLETNAILDIKYSHQKWNEEIIFGLVTSDGEFVVKPIPTPPIATQDHIRTIETMDLQDGLCLSLDWQNRLGGDHNAVVSTSNGSVHLIKSTPTSFILDQSFKGHSFEAWIAAFDYHKINVFYSGGDDCLFKIWDDRGGCVTNKAHEAGVTTVSSHPLQEHVLLTGSYDEQIRVWDTRSLTRPVSSIHTGGGVWRLRWHPKDPSKLLAACMYNGFHIFDYNVDSRECTHSMAYTKHSSIAYGADWSFVDDKIGTASFYDHYFTLWTT